MVYVYICVLVSVDMHAAGDFQELVFYSILFEMRSLSLLLRLYCVLQVLWENLLFLPTVCLEEGRDRRSVLPQLSLVWALGQAQAIRLVQHVLLPLGTRISPSPLVSIYAT